MKKLPYTIKNINGTVHKKGCIVKKLLKGVLRRKEYLKSCYGSLVSFNNHIEDTDGYF